MLCELPGFGGVSAQKVVAAFPTPRSLFEAFEADMRAALGAGGDAVAAARRVLRERAGLSTARAAQVFDELFANGWHLGPAPG
jgi:ribosomal protein S9